MSTDPEPQRPPRTPALIAVGLVALVLGLFVAIAPASVSVSSSGFAPGQEVFGSDVTGSLSCGTAFVERNGLTPTESSMCHGGRRVQRWIAIFLVVIGLVAVVRGLRGPVASDAADAEWDDDWLQDPPAGP